MKPNLPQSSRLAIAITLMLLLASCQTNKPAMPFDPATQPAGQKLAALTHGLPDGALLIGASKSNLTLVGRAAAEVAIQKALTHRARSTDVTDISTADLNRDGFVTIDEVVALSDAGLSDKEIIRRLNATGQYFEIDPARQRSLTTQGVSRRVIAAIEAMQTTDVEPEE